MNTPIIKISDGQNTITHKSGVVTVFEVPIENVFCKSPLFKAYLLV